MSGGSRAAWGAAVVSGLGVSGLVADFRLQAGLCLAAQHRCSSRLMLYKIVGVHGLF